MPSVRPAVSVIWYGLRTPFAWVAQLWTSLRAAQTKATEFAALNALSDAELARMGLTRAVLKRHLRQKYAAKMTRTDWSRSLAIWISRSGAGAGCALRVAGLTGLGHTGRAVWDGP